MEKGSEAALQAALAEVGPIAVAVDASGEGTRVLSQNRTAPTIIAYKALNKVFKSVKLIF